MDRGLMRMIIDNFIKGAIAALIAFYIYSFIPVQQPWNFAIAGGIGLVLVQYVWKKYVIKNL